MMDRTRSSRALRRAVLILGAWGLPASSACRPPHAGTAPASAPRPDVAPDTSALAALDSGVLVRLTLADGGVVTGRLLEPVVVRRRSRAPSTPAPADSGARFVLCEGERAACADRRTARVRSVREAETRALAVRGHLGARLGLGGFYTGTLGGLAVFGTDDPPDRTPGGNLIRAMLVGVATGLVAGGIGSRVPGWEPLYPCFHACGGGHYPAR